MPAHKNRQGLSMLFRICRGLTPSMTLHLGTQRDVRSRSISSWARCQGHASCISRYRRQCVRSPTLPQRYSRSELPSTSDGVSDWLKARFKHKNDVLEKFYADDSRTELVPGAPLAWTPETQAAMRRYGTLRGVPLVASVVAGLVAGQVYGFFAIFLHIMVVLIHHYSVNLV